MAIFGLKYQSENRKTGRSFYEYSNHFGERKIKIRSPGEALHWDFQMRIFGFVNFEMVEQIGYWDRIELVLLYSVIRKKFEKKY